MRRVAAFLVVVAALGAWAVVRSRGPHVARPDLAPAPLPRGGPSSVSLVGVQTREQADGVGGFEGHVTCEGEGVGGAELSFTMGDQIASVLTDAFGAFVFRPTAHGPYALAGIAARGYLPYVPSEGTVRLETRPGKVVTGLVFALVAESSLTVRVVAEAPLPGATVTVHTPGTLAISGPRIGETDEAGTIELGAGAGDLVEVSLDGYDPASHVVTAAEARGGKITVTLVHARGDRVIVDGVVIDDSGKLVDGARVSLVRGDALVAEAITDADGTFSFSSSGDPSLHVRAAKAAYIVDEQPVATDHMTLRLRRGCTITGRVTDRTGPSVASFTLVVRRVSGEGPPPPSPSVYDSDGRYALQGIGAGRYSLQVLAADYAASSTRVVEVTDGCEPVEQSFQLGRGGVVYGRVVDAESGQPLRARVATEGAFGDSTSVRSMATADEDGKYEVGGLPAGRRSLVAEAEGHDSLLLAGIDVRDGDRSGPVDFKLHAVAEGAEPRFELTGIGAALAPGDGVLTIQNALPGGGAAAVGLARGDQITAIDGNEVRTMGFEDATQAIRGPENTTVSLEVTKANGKNVTLVVQRKVVH